MAKTDATATKTRHPRGLAVLFFTEMWERFGFYTMLAIFVLYLDEYFHFGNEGRIYGLYLGFVYFTPIFGGWIADRFGFRRTITVGAILMAIGYGLIAVPLPEQPAHEEVVREAEEAYGALVLDYEMRYEAAQQQAQESGQSFHWEESAPEYTGPGRVARRPLFWIALVVLICGNGLFKPNISVMVGNLYPEGSPLKDSAFNIFYMGINIGAFFAPMAAAALRNSLGWSWAFGAAALGMVISLLIFQGFNRYIRQAEIGRGADATVKIEPLPRDQFWRRVSALMIIFAIVIVFWMSFHQNGFTMTLWARDSTGPLLGKWTISPELFATFNPFFVVTMTPVLVWFWGRLRRRGSEPSTPGKMVGGMLLTAAAFAVLGFAGLIGGDFGRVSPFWLIGAYWVVTIGELCLSPMGLSFVSKVAPPTVRGLMMGCWFGATAIGNLLAGFIEPFWDHWRHSGFFFFLVSACVVMAFVLRAFLGRLKAATAAH
jgi:POT family proton-dependent oligopeptide transporter